MSDGGGSARFRAQCSSCCGLCCVAPSFQEEQGFGFSKPAHTPCSYLQSDFRCSIHQERPERGFPACSAFDCYGAGQRVTRLFASQSWRDSAQAAASLFEAYCLYRALHELLAMLELALPHAAPAARRRLQQRLTWLDELCESGEALTAAIVPEALRIQVLAEIRGAVGAAAAQRTEGLEALAQE